MTVEVRVPQLPESVSDATLVAWHKHPGDAVRRDENLADLETDKVVLEVPSPVSGVFTEARVEPGAIVTGGDLLAILTEGEEPAAEPKPAAKAAGAAKPAAAPKAAAAGGAEAGGKLSPAARRLVEENRLVKGEIAGSGRDGRITKGDVVQHLSKQPEAPGQATPATPVGAARAR